MLATVGFALGRLAVVALIGWTAALLGGRATRGLRFETPLEAVAVALGVGLAALGHLAYLLALTGHFRPAPLVVLALLVHLVAGREVRAAVAVLRRTLVAGNRRRQLPRVAAWSVAVAPAVALALYPPTGFDACNYHLPMASAFADTGTMAILPELRFPIFPQLNELLFALGLLFADDVAAGAVALLPTLAAALAVAAWARRRVGPAAGTWAAALWLGSPLVVLMAGQAYVDLGVAAFAALGLHAVDRWRSAGDEVGGAAPSGWLAVAGFMLASACAVKYLGLLLLALGAAAVGLVAWRRRRPRAVLLFALVALAVLLPWYGRIAWHTGNPVFPYLSGLFGAGDWQLPFERATADGPPFAERLLADATWIVRLPWSVAFDRSTFHHQAPLSPAFLLLLPLIAWLVRRQRWLAWPPLLALGYALGLLYDGYRDLRFLLPAAALLAAAGGAALALAADRRRALGRPAAIVVVAVLLVLPGWAYGAVRLRELGPLPVDAAERSAFLARRMPLYPATEVLERSCGDDCRTYLLFAENVRHHVSGRTAGDWTGPFRYRQVMAVAPQGAAALHARLREFDVDHLLANEAVVHRLPLADPDFDRCFRPLWSNERGRLWELSRRCPAPLS